MKLNFRRAVICFALVIAAGALFLFFQKEAPHNEKLYRISLPHQTCTFIAPSGHQYFILIALPSSSQAYAPFGGNCLLTRDGSTIAAFHFDRNSLVETNWLVKSTGQMSYALSGGAVDAFRLAANLHAKERYKLTLIFDRMPEKGSSIWLHWLR